MKTYKIGPYIITVWWWTKEDKRQKKPTTGYGLIIERS